MRPNRVKALWRENKDVRAAWTLTGDPLTTEILANSGFDAMLIDMQHGFTIGPERVGTFLQVMSTTDVVPMVRVDQGFTFCPFGSDWGFLAEGAEAALREFGPS
jgi:4-hydroxy-2-oxoheptanedioate aldolase